MLFILDGHSSERQITREWNISRRRRISLKVMESRNVPHLPPAFITKYRTSSHINNPAMNAASHYTHSSMFWTRINQRRWFLSWYLQAPTARPVNPSAFTGSLQWFHYAHISPWLQANTRKYRLRFAGSPLVYGSKLVWKTKQQPHMFYGQCYRCTTQYQMQPTTYSDFLLICGGKKGWKTPDSLDCPQISFVPR